MRVTTAFHRLLALQGAGVTDVSFTAEGVVVEVALRCRSAACSGTRATSRTSAPSWPSRWQRRRSPGLLRVRWDTVGRIVERMVCDHLDERRLSGLVLLGVDEIACAPRGAIRTGWDERAHRRPPRRPVEAGGSPRAEVGRSGRSSPDDVPAGRRQRPGQTSAPPGLIPTS